MVSADSHSLLLMCPTSVPDTCVHASLLPVYICELVHVCAEAITCSSGATAKSVALHKYFSQEVCACVRVSLTFSFP